MTFPRWLWWFRCGTRSARLWLRMLIVLVGEQRARALAQGWADELDDEPVPPPETWALPGCDGPRYRKRPVVIEAVQFEGFADDGTDATCNPWPVSWNRAGWRRRLDNDERPCLEIPTLEGPHLARPGDFIIRGIKGEFYPCKPDVFRATYQRARPDGTTRGSW